MRSGLEPFFGTGGASSSDSERASRDFDPEICGQKHNSGVGILLQQKLKEQKNKTVQVFFGRS